jgi:hypothetical protein
MLNDEIKINIKKNQSVLTFKIGDFSHESETNLIKIK